MDHTFITLTEASFTWISFSNSLKVQRQDVHYVCIKFVKTIIAHSNFFIKTKSTQMHMQYKPFYFKKISKKVKLAEV